MGDLNELVERLRGEAEERDRAPDYHEIAITLLMREAAASLTSLMAESDGLREALKPFAEKSKAFDDAATEMGFALSNDEYRPRTSFTHGQLRAARTALSLDTNKGDGV